MSQLDQKDRQKDKCGVFGRRLLAALCDGGILAIFICGSLGRGNFCPFFLEPLSCLTFMLIILLDGMFVAVLPISLLLPLINLISGDPFDSVQSYFVQYICCILVNWLYHALLESSSKQATIGKMLFKIRVSDMEGNRISFAKASIRHFSKILSTLILGIGYLMILWTKNQQALHDKIAGCFLNKAAAACQTNSVSNQVI